MLKKAGSPKPIGRHRILDYKNRRPAIEKLAESLKAPKAKRRILLLGLENALEIASKSRNRKTGFIAARKWLSGFLAKKYIAKAGLSRSQSIAILKIMKAAEDYINSDIRMQNSLLDRGVKWNFIKFEKLKGRSVEQFRERLHEILPTEESIFEATDGLAKFSNSFFETGENSGELKNMIFSLRNSANLADKGQIGKNKGMLSLLTAAETRLAEMIFASDAELRVIYGRARTERSETGIDTPL